MYILPTLKCSYKNDKLINQIDNDKLKNNNNKIPQRFIYKKECNELFQIKESLWSFYNLKHCSVLHDTSSNMNI